MSNWETPEQREIRMLRNRINTLERNRGDLQGNNKKLEKLVSNIQKESRDRAAQYERRLQEERRKSEEQNSKIAAQSKQIQNLHAEVKEKERLQNEKLSEMERQYKEQVTQMRQETQQENKKLKEAIVSTRADMQNGFSELRKERDQKFAEQKKETKRQIQKIEKKLQTEIHEVDSKLDDFIASIKKKENGEKELAEYWTEQANRLFSEIQEYRPQLFAPKGFANLEEKIRLAESDLKQFRFSSAADGGRTAFYDALRLKETVVEAEMEWNQCFYELKEREAEILRMLDSAEERVYELEIDGETIQEDNGIDYWTNGQLSVIRDRIHKFREEELKDLDEKETLYLQEKTKGLLGLMEELIQVENASHTNVAMSLNRYHLAERIGEILGEDYQMTEADGDFFSEENRDEYHAVFENPVTRDQVAVVITPVPGADGVVSNHIELIVGNIDNNPYTREKISKSVQKKLNEEGVLEGGFPCSQKYGDQTAEEVARVGNIAAVSAGNVAARASTERVAQTATSSSTGQHRVLETTSVKRSTTVTEK